MKLVTAAQMRSIDHRAINERGIPGLRLMENAGRGIAEWVREIAGGNVAGKRYLVVSGKGNNGGDGYVIARHLAIWGAKVQVVVIAARDEVKGDARVNLEELRLPVIFARTPRDLPDLAGFDLLIDAIFGTGFQGEIQGLASEVIELLNRGGRPILAVDCPSGLNADTGAIASQCIRATFTGSLALPKLGQYLHPGRAACGEIRVIDIGIPAEVIDSFEIPLSLITEDFVRRTIPDRSATAHKGDAGKVFIIAGSVGLTGAATLAAEAAIRAGSGLVTVGIPRSLNDILEVKLTEAMTRPLPELRKQRCLALRSLGDILDGIRSSDAICLGPGIGRNHETMELCRRLLPLIDRPAVVDADGLYALTGNTDMLAATKAPIVLTPHAGEFARLSGMSVEEIEGSRIENAKDFSCKTGKILVLKGAPTVVANPDGTVYLNSTGNCGMATGGAGDVLSGIICAFLGMKLPPLEATLCGVFVHGLAGDLAKSAMGTFGMNASDLIHFTAQALKSLKDKKG